MNHALNSDIAFLPSSDDQLAQLVARLRQELDAHFSFAPKSEAKLEEVLLGTLGMTSGRQQWQALRDRPIIDGDLLVAIHDAVTQQRIHPELQALMHHEDRQVRALAQNVARFGQDFLVLTYSAGDLYGLKYGQHLTAAEVRACFRMAQGSMDANYGMDWDALDDYAASIIQRRVFHSASITSPLPDGDAHGIRYYGMRQVDELKGKPFGWYDDSGVPYTLVIPDVEEDDAYLLNPNEDRVNGTWAYLAR